MRNFTLLKSIERELDSFKPDSHWDDESIIDYYKKKTREICSRLEEDEKIRKKQLLLFNNNKKFLTKNIKYIKTQQLKRSGSSFHSPLSSNNLRISRLSSPIKRINSPKVEKIEKIEEPESVLNMLFPYVNEIDFKIEPFKSGADLRNENRIKRENIPVIKINQERRIKSNYIKKFKKYDKMSKIYPDSTSIRRSSSYVTLEQIKRRELLKNKKFWISPSDFQRYFRRNMENNINKDINKKNNYICDKYVDPRKTNFYRIVDKNKWISKKDFSFK